MPSVTCKFCKNSFEKRQAEINRTKNNFCSKSCSASYNNKKSPRRTKSKKCKFCSNLIYSTRQKCPDCIAKFSPKDLTLGDAIYRKHHPSSAYALVRSRARSMAKKLGWKSCTFCGYDKHIEIAHKKPIADFDESTPISTINDPDNLLPLCPNCHWEHDNDML